MSIVHRAIHRESKTSVRPATSNLASLDQANNTPNISEILGHVASHVSPVWPLADYVAVNPYGGFAPKPFLTARASLRAISDIEMLMPIEYYSDEYSKKAFDRMDIDAAIAELKSDQVPAAEHLNTQRVLTHLHSETNSIASENGSGSHPIAAERRIRTFAEMLDLYTGTSWHRLIVAELSKHCSAHYDRGQATWSSPWRHAPLYAAWRSTARYDRNFEILGVSGFRQLVGSLPHQPDAALAFLLEQLGIPSRFWTEYLLCEAFSIPGWSAWARYQDQRDERNGEEGSHVAGLLAMRLAYETALSRQSGFQVDWSSVLQYHREHHHVPRNISDDGLIRLVLLKANEIAFRRQLTTRLTASVKQSHDVEPTHRTPVQMVFCIDVRSECIRRHLESASDEIETFGFAGFFGIPIQLVPLGEQEGRPHVPALLAPQMTAHEELDTDDCEKVKQVSERRSALRFVRKAWKEFQSSPTSSFAFVETSGLFYGLRLIGRMTGSTDSRDVRFDGIRRSDRVHLSPTLKGLSQQGMGRTQQVDLAESILRGSGVGTNLGRLVVLCGHTSQSENNPLQAGLDCGACGGHSGEANARLAAKLLNQGHIRQALSSRGIVVPEDTYFLAAVHNTTTDEIEYFDTRTLPLEHKLDFEKLIWWSHSAATNAAKERLPSLSGCRGDDCHNLHRRSRDWSEVRPEWGLAGNAAFVAAPRHWTKHLSLDGRAFLHSYDFRNDRNSTVLEQILTAPLIVAHWINMQYYASTVDPIHFGSGTKTIHNVVGRFGILAGHGGDLMTGLPWQSIHDGKRFQHQPLRLLAIIAAPRGAIAPILDKHHHLTDLLQNGWLNLIAIEEGRAYRYTQRQSWESLGESESFRQSD